MPIKGLTERQCLPRIGKIHLGVKVQKTNEAGEVISEYPRAVDYFVCPPEVQAVFGEQPRLLRVMIPVEDDDQWCSQYFRAYSRTRGLTCKGDGETARRLVDVATGDLVNKDSKEAEWRQVGCPGRDCPDYQAKKCSELMNLMFMLPEVPGLGIWQIDTTSINSIRNINASAFFLRQAYGRIRMVPLKLTLEQIEVNNPDDGKKKKVWVMKLGAVDSFFDVVKRMLEVSKRLPAGADLALPAPDQEAPDYAFTNGEAAYDVPSPLTGEDEIADLWEKTIERKGEPPLPETPAKAATASRKAKPTTPATPSATPPPVSTATPVAPVTGTPSATPPNNSAPVPVEPKELRNCGDLMKAANDRWGLLPSEVEAKLKKSRTQMADLWAEWAELKKRMEGKNAVV